MAGNRHTIRLAGYDYTADGFYFFTAVTKDRAPWFGQILDGEMKLSESGKLVWQEWKQTPAIRKRLTLDEFIVMPDHVHGILIIGNPTLPLSGSPWPPLDEFHTSAFSDNANTLGTVIGGFKAACSRGIRKQYPEFGWTSNYWERIIRSYDELNAYRLYIKNNPSRPHEGV